MNNHESIPKQIGKTILKMGGGLIVLYFLLMIVIYSLNAFGESRKYGHCDTYDGFIKTAEARNITPDSTRLRDFQTTKVLLEVYLSDNGSYPIITSGSSKDRWTELFAQISSEYNYGVGDPCLEKNNEYQYSYGSSEDGSDYILRAVMSQEGIYNSPIKNEVYGIWCGDSASGREYCVGPPQE